MWLRERSQQRRINSTRQKQSHGHVRTHAQSNAVLKELNKLVDRVPLTRDSFTDVIGDVPVGNRLERAAARVILKVVAWLEPEDIAINRLLVRTELQQVEDLVSDE